MTGRGIPDDPEHPARARLWIKVDGTLVGRPDDPDGRVHLRQRPDPARRRAGAARHPHRLAAAPAGVARPHDLVPPALPRRRVVALRPVLAVRRRRPRAGARAGVLAVGRAGRDGGPGGPDPAPRGLARRQAARTTQQVGRAVLRAGEREGPAGVVLAGGEGDRAREEDRLLEGDLDGDGRRAAGSRSRRSSAPWSTCRARSGAGSPAPSRSAGRGGSGWRRPTPRRTSGRGRRAAATRRRRSARRGSPGRRAASPSTVRPRRR